MKKWLLLGLLLVMGAAAFGFSRGWPFFKKDPASLYRQAETTRGEIVSVVNSTGTVQPVQSVQVGAFVSGPILRSKVDFNTEVKAGQVIAEIDPRIYEAHVARDEASLAHAKAEVVRVEALLEQAKNNNDRAVKLRAKKVSYISDAEMDKFAAERKSLEAQAELAQAAIKQADAALKLSRANLDYTVITSPVDGLIIDRKIDPGQTVAAAFQTPVLFVVAPNLREKVYVYASVDEADIGQIRRAKDRNEPVAFTVDAYPDDLFTGTIFQIRLNPTTTNNVVTYTVVVGASNPELKLLPGMTASLSFQIERHPNVIKVPNAALRFYPKPEQVHERYRDLLEGIEDALPTAATDTAADRQSATEKAAAARNRNRRHVWKLDGDRLSAVEVYTGLSDSQYTELVSGDLVAGQKLVIGIKPPTSASN